MKSIYSLINFPVNIIRNVDSKQQLDKRKATSFRFQNELNAFCNELFIET